MINIEKHIAITLSEVLITLGIIGIVSALILRNVVVNFQKHVTVNRLKTNYAIFSQPVEKSINMNMEIFPNGIC